MTSARGWWRRHGPTVALVGVVLTLGVGLGVTAPSTSPVDDPRFLAPGTVPGPDPRP